MSILRYNEYVKLIVIKLDDFSSEIIDEANFGLNDYSDIEQFTKKYSRRDDCIIVSTNM